jgi:hypothetical protein
MRGPGAAIKVGVPAETLHAIASVVCAEMPAHAAGMAPLGRVPCLLLRLSPRLARCAG